MRRILLSIFLFILLFVVNPAHAQGGTPPTPTPNPIDSCFEDGPISCLPAVAREWGVTGAAILIAISLAIFIVLRPVGKKIQETVESWLDRIPFSRRAGIRRYLKVFVQQNKMFGFRGMEMLALQPIELSRAYVQLDLVFEPEEAGRKALSEAKKIGTVERDVLFGREGKGALAVSEILQQGHKRLAVVGDAGSGKSALLQWIGLSVAQGYLGTRLSEGQKEFNKAIKFNRWLNPLLPLIVPLRKYHSYCKENKAAITPDSLHAYIGNYVQHEYKRENLPKGLFHHMLKRGCVVMFDGVDEVDYEDRPVVRAAVEGVVENHNNCRKNIYIITTRPSGANITSQLAGFRAATVQPLTTEKRQELIDLWCQAVYSIATEADAKATDLFRRIQDDLVRDMAGTPLMVNIFALVYYHRRDLPSQRAELFEYAVLALLTDPHKQGQAVADSSLWGGRQLQQRRDDMALIAYILHDAGRDDIFADELIRKSLFWKRFGAEKESAQQKASEFLDLVARRGGLLRQDGQRYDFYIRRFREFLAGRYVAQKLEDQWSKVIQKHIFDDQWEEPLQLAIGFLAFSNLEKAEKLLRQLLAIGKREDCHDRALTIAGLALGDVLKISDAQVESVFASHKKRIPGQLLKLFEKNPPASPTRLRYRLGLALGKIGDPRVTDPLEPAMIFIPAGDFQMGTSEAEEAELKEQKTTVYSDEKPAHQVFLSGFSIAKYPVTTAEFRAFYNAKGYENESLWSKAGWRWRRGQFDSDLSWISDKELRGKYRNWLAQRPEEKRSRPFFWGGPKWNTPNLPVVGVTWFEAQAYANWLCAETGLNYRLPSEAQWEKAARGPENTLWPWGNDWDADRCNNAELEDKLGGTSPVGLYPHGTWAGGPCDMVGNIWEWCADEWKEDVYQERVDKENHDPLETGIGSTRVLRGGSWNLNRFYARCACRYGFDPDYFNYNVGFRVVLLLPS